MDRKIAVEMVEELAWNPEKNDDLQNDQCSFGEKKHGTDACGSTARSERESNEERKGVTSRYPSNGKKINF